MLHLGRADADDEENQDTEEEPEKRLKTADQDEESKDIATEDEDALPETDDVKFLKEQFGDDQV